MNTKTETTSSPCTCGVKFADPESYRDHLPCDGSDVDQLRADVATLLKVARAAKLAADNRHEQYGRDPYMDDLVDALHSANISVPSLDARIAADIKSAPLDAREVGRLEGREEAATIVETCRICGDVVVSERLPMCEKTDPAHTDSDPAEHDDLASAIRAPRAPVKPWPEPLATICLPDHPQHGGRRRWAAYRLADDDYRLTVETEAASSWMEGDPDPEPAAEWEYIDEFVLTAAGFAEIADVIGMALSAETESIDGDAASIYATGLYSVHLEWSPEDESFIATVPELPGCMADGGTRSLAIVAAERTIVNWLRAARERGYESPAPRLMGDRR